MPGGAGLGVQLRQGLQGLLLGRLVFNVFLLGLRLGGADFVGAGKAVEQGHGQAQAQHVFMRAAGGDGVVGAAIAVVGQVQIQRGQPFGLRGAQSFLCGLPLRPRGKNGGVALAGLFQPVRQGRQGRGRCMAQVSRLVRIMRGGRARFGHCGLVISISVSGKADVVCTVCAAFFAASRKNVLQPQRLRGRQACEVGQAGGGFGVFALGAA